MSDQDAGFPRIELDLDASAPVKRPKPSAEASLPLGMRLRTMPEVSQMLSMAYRFASDPDRASGMYANDPETNHGSYISGDELVRVMPWTRDNPLLSYRFCGEAVAALPLKMFRKRMAMPCTSSEEWVLFTMGMPACGKTTLVKGGMGRGFHTVVDSPLSERETARELRQIARESGRNVAFVFAYRPLALAVKGMLERALPWHEGRTVSLEHMASTLVKGLALFLDLAESNASDDGTTLDLVEVVDGRRQWLAGEKAVQRVEAIRSELLDGGISVLHQLLYHWRVALCEAEEKALEIPPLLIELAQEDLDPRILAISDLALPSRTEILSIASSTLSSVRSLTDIAPMQDRLPSWLEQADAYEASLRGLCLSII
jgi:hypothetical protein